MNFCFFPPSGENIACMDMHKNPALQPLVVSFSHQSEVSTPGLEIVLVNGVAKDIDRHQTTVPQSHLKMMQT